MVFSPIPVHLANGLFLEHVSRFRLQPTSNPPVHPCSHSKNIDIEVDIDEICLGGGPVGLLWDFFVIFASKRHSVAFPKDNGIRFSCIGAFD